MSVVVTLHIGGQALIAELDDDALAAVAASLSRLAPQSPSPYMTIFEAAEFLRARRQRVDDLLSAGRLTRFKDGSRTLVSRAEIQEHLTQC